MSGETSMLATRTTELFSARPRAAITLTPVSHKHTQKEREINNKINVQNSSLYTC